MMKLTFLGDIMCDYTMTRGLEKYRDRLSGTFDFSTVFAHIRPMLESSDYVFSNLETPISANDDNLTGKKWNFNSPIEFAKAVKECGVDFVSTANNHCLDRGLDGLVSTINSLDAVGLAHCGTQTKRGNEYTIVNVGGLRIGVLAYTYGTNAFSNNCYLPKKRLWAVNMLQAQEGRIKRIWRRLFGNRLEKLFAGLEKRLYPDNVGKQIYEKETFSLYRKLLIKRDLRKIKRERVDLVVTYLHIGGQYNLEPSSYTKRVTNWFLSKGCDIVIDNHEHVVHGSMISSNKIAAYALGNCVGSAGVLHGPFDRRAEYSIALHTYINEKTKRVQKVSFSILKTIIGVGDKYETWQVSDLLDRLQGEEREQLLADCLKTAKDFAGIEFKSIAPEFVIKDV